MKARISDFCLSHIIAKYAHGGEFLNPLRIAKFAFIIPVTDAWLTGDGSRVV